MIKELRCAPFMQQGYRMSHYPFMLACGLLIITNSCSLGPTYQPPVVETAADWKHTQNNTNPFVYRDFWWEVFNDEQLEALEQQALENNYDLMIALNHVQEAKALMEDARADIYPHLNVNPLYSNMGTLYESYSTFTLNRAHEMLFVLPLNFSYELDLWGKIRSRYEAARYNWEGAIEAYNSLLLTLTTDVATVYYQLRVSDAQIDLLQATLQTRQSAFKINNSRYKANIINYSDVTRAGLEVSNTLSEIKVALRQRAKLENSLATLIGISASEFSFAHSPLEGVPPVIPAGIPSDVLLRRPDIAEAERRMAAENAMVRVTYASFLPSIGLTAGLGSSSPHLKYFLQNKGRLWSYGAHASQVIFDGGRLFAELAMQEARFNEASAAYQQQVLVAFQQVEDALISLEMYKKEYQDVADAVEWAKKTNRIANSRYKLGVTFYLDVVESEREKLIKEIVLNDLMGLRFATTIQLIKAIGGGWSCGGRIDINH